MKSVSVGRSLRRRLAAGIGLPSRSYEFTTSGDYWDQRYRSGGNSGVGSYGRLAEFKAEFLNRFVSDNSITSVIEFGSGDGAQLLLANYPSYVGVDVSKTAVKDCRSLFADKPNFKFLHTSEFRPDMTADLALSLDVIYHLVEDETYSEYMSQLFDAASRFAIIYSSNQEGRPAAHVRHRRFTDWVASHRSDFELVEHKPNPYPPGGEGETSFADFYVFRRTSGS